MKIEKLAELLAFIEKLDDKIRDEKKQDIEALSEALYSLADSLLECFRYIIAELEIAVGPDGAWTVTIPKMTAKRVTLITRKNLPDIAEFVEALQKAGVPVDNGLDTELPFVPIIVEDLEDSEDPEDPENVLNTISKTAVIDTCLELSEARRKWGTAEGRAEMRGIDAVMCAIHDLGRA